MIVSSQKVFEFRLGTIERDFLKRKNIFNLHKDNAFGGKNQSIILMLSVVNTL